jgi:hypothetical protein
VPADAGERIVVGVTSSSWPTAIPQRAAVHPPPWPVAGRSGAP